MFTLRGRTPPQIQRTPGQPLTADVDHDGPELLRKRLVAYLTNAAIQP